MIERSHPRPVVIDTDPRMEGRSAGSADYNSCPREADHPTEPPKFEPSMMAMQNNAQDSAPHQVVN